MISFLFRFVSQLHFFFASSISNKQETNQAKKKRFFFLRLSNVFWILVRMCLNVFECVLVYLNEHESVIYLKMKMTK